MPGKLVIFGGSGFVGGNMTHIAQGKHWEVFAADSRPGLRAERWLVDITAPGEVDRVISELNPSAVVNAAAIADIDLAERDREKAYRVNVQGAMNVAESCARRAIAHVFFSSDAVFDGKASQYVENDLPNPTNFYGKTKVEAEKAVMAAHPATVVVRISLVLGFPIVTGNSLFASLERKLKEGKEIPCPMDEIRTPVDVFTLSECVLELIETKYSGVIHIGATDSISRYELTRKLARRMGYAEELVRGQAVEELKPGRAPRHNNGIIRVDRAQQILKTRLLTTEESIDRAFTERIKPVEAHDPGDRYSV